MKVNQSIKFDQEWKEVSEKQREVYAAFIGIAQIEPAAVCPFVHT